MFGLSIKENVFNYIIDMFAMNYIKNENTLWHLKVIIYDLINCVLHSFDENSLNGENLRILFDLCYFCMDKNDYTSQKFWNACQSIDRDNITLLMGHSIDTFPISFRHCLTFFSLIAKTSPQLCKQIFEYLNNMDQYCEYLDNLNLDEYVTSGDSVRLVKNRELFDGYVLRLNQKGQLLNVNNSHKIILQSQAITWSICYSFFDLTRHYLSRINHSIEQSEKLLFFFINFKYLNVKKFQIKKITLLTKQI
jgi:hypothetical protein